MLHRRTRFGPWGAEKPILLAIKAFRVCVCVWVRRCSHLSETQQQLVRLQEVCAFSLQSSIESVAVVAKLIAALHDERHGVVVTSRQLVSVKDEDLSLRHRLLPQPTNTHLK